MKHPILTGHFVAVFLMTATSLAMAAPSASSGPQGFLLWATPNDVAQISFEDSDGTPFTLADFEGKLILLNIWATWCGPCREEMPTLDALQDELGSDDFEVVALSIEIVNEFYQEIGIEHLAPYIDKTGMASADLGAVGIPTTLLLDRQGKEIGRLVGEAEWNTQDMIDFLAEMIATR